MTNLFIRTRFPAVLAAICVFLASGLVAAPANAHNDASAISAVSALPIASVVVGTSAVAAAPLVLSAAGTVLVVKTVTATARGTLLVLERASDGARFSVEIASEGIAAASLAAGTVVTVSVIGAGVVLSVAAEAIAFLPNALGKALLHNERL
jgi:hypothetical protein